MNSFIKKIKELKNTFISALDSVKSQSELETLRIEYLGKKGHISLLNTEFKKLSADERKEVGPHINNLKQETQKLYLKKKQELIEKELQTSIEKQKHFDVSAYIPHQQFGSLHPLTLLKEDIENIFISMGFTIADGPEVETEFYNFEALNIPEGHPARDMWDTFYLDIPSLLLRTHTSTVQIHTMEKEDPPIAILAPGRCYRHEATDASHDFMFMQAEGLMIGKDISMGNLLATMKTFLQAIFKNEEINIRVRPSYFPFVEPGVEIDCTCPFCFEGCSTCKQTGWIEIAGAGLVHPNVLKFCNIDHTQFSGFAFGFGLTRLAMLKYGIHDIRLLHSSNIAFLRQF